MPKVPYLSHCLVCSQPIDHSKRQRAYCSTPCRNKYHNKKHQAHRVIQARKRSDAKASQPCPDKKQCILCLLWFKRVSRHVNIVHHLTAYEYKQMHNLPTTHGILSDASREHLRVLNKQQDAQTNLLTHGIQTRYMKGDPRTKAPKSYWVGRDIPNDLRNFI